MKKDKIFFVFNEVGKYKLPSILLHRKNNYIELYVNWMWKTVSIKLEDKR